MVGAAAGGGSGVMADEGRNPVRTENPDGAGPFVIVCDHASNRLPREYGSLGLSSDALAQPHRLGSGCAAGVARTVRDARRAAPLARRLAADRRLQSRPRRARPDRRRKRGQGGPRQSRRRREGAGPPPRRDPRSLSQRHRPGASSAASAPAARPRVVAVHSFTPVYLGRSRPWEIGIVFDDDRRLSDPLIAALKADPGADGRRQPALFAGRPRLLHADPPRPSARPAGGDDRDQERPHRRRGRAEGVGRSPRRNPCFAFASGSGRGGCGSVAPGRT